MERQPLRPAVPVEAVDPLAIAPDPGEMGQLYLDGRAIHPDGMSLACAIPRRPYEEIKAEYARTHDNPDFSIGQFLADNFEMPEPESGLMVAPPGMTLNEYTLAIRPLFIHPSSENSGFDTWLPYDRSVAGAGRFSKHSFLWDGYQMAKGYASDGRWDLVLNIVDNTEYQINRFGYGLNGSADFYATRSQPPYFSNEISMLADEPEYGDEALIRYLPAIEKEYQGYWMEGQGDLAERPDDGKVHGHRSLIRLPLPNGKFGYLNRYWDDADGPRLESYQEDVELGERVTMGLEGEEKQRRLQKLFKDLRAAAASGWDFSSRWCEDGVNLESINTTDVLPVDLNSLLARTEMVLARGYFAKGDEEKGMAYLERAQLREAAINTYLWDPAKKIYRDFNFAKCEQTAIVSSAMAYPLYVGIANAEQTFGVAEAVKGELLFPGGVVATTTEDSTQQWDGGKGLRNVWAPPNWATARGFARMAYILQNRGENVDTGRLLDLADETRHNYMYGIQTVFDNHGVVPEKHNGEDPSQIGGGGEYKPVKLLAMPAETYRAMKVWNPRDPNGCLPIGQLAFRRAKILVPA